MSAPRIKLIGSGHYHIYSRLVLGEFLLTERKEMRFGRVVSEYWRNKRKIGVCDGKRGVSARAVRRLLGEKIRRK